MDSKTELRKRFLKEFVSVIVFNMPVKKRLFYPERNLEIELKKGILNQIENNYRQFEQIQIPSTIKVAPQFSSRIQEIGSQKPAWTQRIIQINQNEPRGMRVIPAKWEPKVIRMSDNIPRTESGNNISLITIDSIPKLNEFINNPNIFSIECPGPGKPLTINQNGRINSYHYVRREE